VRVSWTLLGHITLELWRHVLLTTAVLVLVTAFGATVQHYAKGQLSAVDTLKFMGLAAVPMLAYAIPFAGAMAGTLAYHRLAQERELMAAQAGGMSLLALLTPAIVTGVVLTAALAVLSEQVIPRFLQRMGEVASGQAAGLISRAIERGEAVQVEGFLLYADQVFNPEASEPGIQAHLVLLGAHLVRLDEEGNMVSWGAAERADLWVMEPREVTEADLVGPGDAPGAPGERVSEVIYRVRDAVGDAGPLADGRVGEYQNSWYMPGGGGDSPKFLTWGEMRRAYRNPDPLGPIDAARRDLAFHLALRSVIERTVNELRGGGAVQMEGADGSTLVLRAGGIEWDDEALAWRLRPRGSQPITVERFRPEGGGARSVDRFELGDATIEANLTGDPSNRGMELVLHGENVRTALAQGPDQGTRVGGVREKVELGPLRVQDDPVSASLAMSSNELLAAVEAHNQRWGSEDPFLTPPTQDLRKRITKLRKQILGKHHERLALSASAIVLAIAGAVAAIRFQEASPLVAYLGAFLPALGLVLAISTGQQMVDDYGRVALPILWGGPVLMAVAVVWVSMRVGQRKG
jgi:lipopolysaccharide export LptBFGC system permease protein LptF